MYEYGIVHVASDINNNKVVSVHRSGLMKYEAERWLAEFLEDGGKPDSFKIVKRPIGEWEIIE